MRKSVIKALHKEWICNLGYPSTGFWGANGGEFSNSNMTELTAKAGFLVKFGPANSPWANGINERNHATADRIVQKIIDTDPAISLEEAVAMAAWTHNIT